MRRLVTFCSVGLLLIDAPFILIALLASLRYGLSDTLVAVVDWRQAHPSTYAVSVVLLLLVAYRRRAT